MSKIMYAGFFPSGFLRYDCSAWKSVRPFSSAITISPSSTIARPAAQSASWSATDGNRAVMSLPFLLASRAALRSTNATIR
ncbi:MAG: hypothetical protein BWY81_01410 [Firmicutes bacterium ADurb.Bin467]|nr:MAG: hypothetical protein BWY81_01410 [Firmicutes bacterium ADurb.Bin467]